MWGRPDRKHNMLRRNQRDSCRVAQVQGRACSNDCASITAPVLSWTFPYQVMPNEIRSCTRTGQVNWKRCAQRRAGGKTWALSTGDVEHISITKGDAHGLEVRSAMMQCGLTLKVVCETDPSAAPSMPTRRVVSRVRHLDARLLWLQELRAEGVERRARPGEHNEADLGTKVVDL